MPKQSMISCGTYSVQVKRFNVSLVISMRGLGAGHSKPVDDTNCSCEAVPVFFPQAESSKASKINSDARRRLVCHLFISFASENWVVWLTAMHAANQQIIFLSASPHS